MDEANRRANNAIKIAILSIAISLSIFLISAYISLTQITAIANIKKELESVKKSINYEEIDDDIDKED